MYDLNTVKLCLTTMYKILPSSQDNHFCLVVIFLVRYTSINKCVKTTTYLYYVTVTTPNLDIKWPKCYQRRLRQFCAACLPCWKFYPGHFGKILYKEPFKKTTFLRWSIFISSQGSHIRQVLLYIYTQYILAYNNIYDNIAKEFPWFT